VSPSSFFDSFRASAYSPSSRRIPEDKTTPDYFSVLIYHGPDRKKIKLKKLKKYDVVRFLFLVSLSSTSKLIFLSLWQVLTTYSTLVLDFPDDEGALKKAKAKAKKSGGDADDYFEFQEKGPLLQIGWYRVILDEARKLFSSPSAPLLTLMNEMNLQKTFVTVKRRCLVLSLDSMP